MLLSLANVKKFEDHTKRRSEKEEERKMVRLNVNMLNFK